MTKKSKKNNKLIAGICAAVAVIAVIVVVAVLIVRGAGGLNDSYFVSDDTKYVLTLDGESVAFEESEFTPVKSHLVYTYSGDEITGLKAYYEYADAAAAKAAYDYLSSSEEAEYEEIAIDGKYVILTAGADQYEELTAEDVKQQIEFMEMLKNMDTEGLESGEEDTTEVIDNGSSDIVVEEATE